MRHDPMLYSLVIKGIQTVLKIYSVNIVMGMEKQGRISKKEREEGKT